mgnify:CR=1 FL=1
MNLRPSWILLQDEPSTLSDDIRVLDLYKGRDIGWVSQMNFLLDEYASEGMTVLDPFAGLGTTLLASGLRGLTTKGFEIEATRVELGNRRLQEAGVSQHAEILHADSRKMPLMRESIDLILTSVPYFGAERSTDEGWTKASGQLYFSRVYEEYLALLEDVVAESARVLRKDHLAVFVAENVMTKEGGFFPVAWDLARLMGKHLQLKEERVLVYPHNLKNLDREIRHDSHQTDRRHEYVLIGSKRLSDLDGTANEA